MENVCTQTSNESTQENHKEVMNTTPNRNVPAINEQGLSRINLFDAKQLAAAENFLEKVMRSEKGGIKSVNDGLAVLMRAQDLNLPFSTCLEHIHIINGKTGVDIHIIKALLLKAGCTWELVKDYQPLYEYTDGINVFNDGSFPDYAIRCNNKQSCDKRIAEDADAAEHIYLYPVRFFKDFNNNIYREYQVNPTKFGIVRNMAEAKEVQTSGKIAIYRIPAVPVDFITEYKLKRVVNGNYMEINGRFSRSEAFTAGLFEKDTYVKYARILIGHRAFTYAAREIASDVLFGVMETTELKVTASVDIEEQDVIEIDSKPLD